MNNQVSEEITNTKRRESRRPNFPEFMHSNNSGGV